MTLVVADCELIRAAAVRKGCSSAEALRRRFGMGHGTWTKLLNCEGVRSSVLDAACKHLELNRQDVEIRRNFMEIDRQRGIRIIMTIPTVLSFRGEKDPRKAPGRGIEVVRSRNNRLLLLLSHLQIDVVEPGTECFIESVRAVLEFQGARQTLDPFRWCSIADSNSEANNPDGYWHASRMNPPGWTETMGPVGFHLGGSAPSSICEECSFVALRKGDIRTYADFLDILVASNSSGTAKCTLEVDYRVNNESVFRPAETLHELRLDHLKKTMEHYIGLEGYAAHVPYLVGGPW